MTLLLIILEFIIDTRLFVVWCIRLSWNLIIYHIN